MFDPQRNGARKGRGTESVPVTEGLPADSAVWFQDVVGRAEGALTCLQGASPGDISPPVSSALLGTLEEPGTRGLSKHLPQLQDAVSLLSHHQGPGGALSSAHCPSPTGRVRD